MKSALVLCMAAGIAWLSVSALAADPATRPGAAVLGEGKGQVTLSWDEFVKITGYDPAKKNQTLTIPWSEVESLLGVEIKGKVPLKMSTVDLPWSEFRELLMWSVKKHPGGEAPPPADFIVTSCQYIGQLGNEEAKFTLKLVLDVLRKDGWKRIPLLPSTVAVTDSKLTKGVYLNSTNNTYELLTDQSGKIEATIQFSVAPSKSAGIYSVAFDRVMAGPSVLDLSIEGKPGEPVDVKVASSQSLVSKVDGATTKVQAALPSAPSVAISWERALPKVAAAPSKLYADTRTLVAVAEGLLVCQEAVDLSILHTPVKELKFQAPKGASILEVTGTNVQDWRADKDGQILVVPRGEVIGPYGLRISYEAPAGETADIPVIRAVGVEREKGFVGVIALANVEIDAGDVQGATKIDVRQLPSEIAAMTKQPILLGFRYVTDKFTMPLAIKKHAEVNVLTTVVDSALLTTMQLDDGRRMTRAIYTVRNNRNQFLRVKMPARAEMWSVSVSGNTVNPASDEKGNILIPLVRSSASAAELASFPVELVYVETPEKAAPASGRLHVELPRLDTATLHVMVNYYAPGEGKYETSTFLGPTRSGFSGSLRLTKDFAAMSSDRSAETVLLNAPKQAQAMQQQFENKMDTEARAAGATPIRVRLPINGKLFKLEKILALPGDDLYFDVQYSDWKPAK